MFLFASSSVQNGKSPYALHFRSLHALCTFHNPLYPCRILLTPSTRPASKLPSTLEAIPTGVPGTSENSSSQRGSTGSRTPLSQTGLALTLRLLCSWTPTSRSCRTRCAAFAKALVTRVGGALRKLGSFSWEALAVLCAQSVPDFGMSKRSVGTTYTVAAKETEAPSVTVMVANPPREPKKAAEGSTSSPTTTRRAASLVVALVAVTVAKAVVVVSVALEDNPAPRRLSTLRWSTEPPFVFACGH